MQGFELLLRVRILCVDLKLKPNSLACREVVELQPRQHLVSDRLFKVSRVILNNLEKALQVQISDSRAKPGRISFSRQRLSEDVPLDPMSEEITE